MKILLIDDELSIKKLVAAMAQEAGCEFSYAEDGAFALEAARRERPDVIIMDVMMPKVDGFSACRTLRSNGVNVPVIFLSAKGDIVDKGIGFQAGGDDYMTKPFDPRELMMHADALVRRAHMTAAVDESDDNSLELGRFRIDSKQHRVFKDDAAIKLTPKEFKIFHTLAAHPDVVLSKDELVESAWGKEFVGETTSITVFMKKLRAKVEDDPSDPLIIETVWGIGYRLNSAACE